MSTAFVAPINKITMHSTSRILVRMDTLIPASRSTVRPRYRSGVLSSRLVRKLAWRSVLVGSAATAL